MFIVETRYFFLARLPVAIHSLGAIRAPPPATYVTPERGKFVYFLGPVLEDRANRLVSGEVVVEEPDEQGDSEQPHDAHEE